MTDVKGLPVPTPVKKVAKKAVKKVAKKAVKKVAKKAVKKVAIRKDNSSITKAEKKRDKIDAAFNLLNKNFEEFCKKNNIKGICIFAESKHGITGNICSKGLKQFERIGLTEVNGLTSK